MHRMKLSAKLGLALCLGLLTYVSPSPCRPQDQAVSENGQSKSNWDQFEDLAQEGFRLISSGKYQAAVSKIEAALKLQPNNSGCLCNYGVALMDLGRTDEAEVALKRAIELEPKMAVAWMNLASCYQLSGRAKEAIETFRQCLKYNTDAKEIASIKSEIASLEETLNDAKNAPPKSDSDYLAEAIQYAANRWPEKEMPVKIHIVPGLSVPHYRPEFVEILKKSFLEWQEASNGLVSFVFIDKPEDANVVCTWNCDPNQKLVAVELGDARLHGRGHAIVGGEIKFQTLDPNGLPLTDVCARKVDLHEIGHILGLSGHSSNPNDVMFYVVNEKDVGLSDKDKNTLVALYSMEEAKLNERSFDALHSAPNDSTPASKAARLNNEAGELLSHNKPLEAIAKFREAIHLDPTMTHQQNLGLAYENAGYQAWRAGEMTKAAEMYDKAMEILAKWPASDLYKELKSNFAKFQQVKGTAQR